MIVLCDFWIHNVKYSVRGLRPSYFPGILIWETKFHKSSTDFEPDDMPFGEGESKNAGNLLTPEGYIDSWM